MQLHKIECIQQCLSAYQRDKKIPAGKTAAVLIPLFYRSGQLEIIFTKRQRGLNNHGGEVSFPGGGVEEQDKTLRDTALRETEEETGIDKNLIEVIGKLDDEISITGFKVTPYVGFIKRELELEELRIDESEVEKIFSVKLSHFLDKKVKWTETWVREGMKRKVYFYKFDDLIIWGLTGRILHKFLKVIEKCMV